MKGIFPRINFNFSTARDVHFTFVSYDAVRTKRSEKWGVVVIFVLHTNVGRFSLTLLHVDAVLGHNQTRSKQGEQKKN